MADSNYLSPMGLPPEAPAVDPLQQATQVPTTLPSYTPEQIQAYKEQQFQDLANSEANKQVLVDPELGITDDVGPAMGQKNALGIMEQVQAQKAAEQQRALSLSEAQQQQSQEMNARRAALGMAPLPGAAPSGVSVDEAALPASAFESAPKGPESEKATAKTNNPMDQYQQGYNTQIGAIDSAMKAGRDKAVAETKELQTKERLYNEQAATNKLREVELKEVGDNALRKYEATQDEIGKFKFKDYWDDKTAGDKVVASLAIALGGIGGTLTGKFDNKALDIINKTIERDLDLQKLNYTRLKDKGEGAKNLYGMYMSKFNNETLASNATYAALLNASNTRLEQIAAPYDNQMVQTKMQMLKGQLSQQQAAKLVEMQQVAQISAIKNGTANVDLKKFK
jgi:hypothetical protein